MGLVQQIVEEGKGAMNLSAEWVLGIVLGFVSGSYIFTWKVFTSGRADRKELWEAITKLKDNDLHHLEERVAKLEATKKHD